MRAIPGALLLPLIALATIAGGRSVATPIPAVADTSEPVIWGDVGCNGELTSVDALQVLRFTSGVGVWFPEGVCWERFIHFGTVVDVDGVARTWGDLDCDNDIDAVDALKILRGVAALAVSQTEPCPDIGTPVQVTH